jgi:hypothetical protein
MSSSWCMYCKVQPKDRSSVPAAELWSISQGMQFVESITVGHLEEAKCNKNTANLPFIDYMEPKYYIFPQLPF